MASFTLYKYGFQKILLLLLPNHPQKKKEKLMYEYISYSGFEGLYGYIMDYIACIKEHKAV